jgi:signal recognition particle subunit SRP54
MFESLQEGLRSALKSLRGKGRLTESNMRESLALVEQALLEADVAYSVVKDFMQRVASKALGQNVLESLDPGQQFIGIVHDELIEVMGPVDFSIPLRKSPTVLMLCGLQGSGKTTTCGKLARLLKQQGVRPYLVAADLQRPAAMEQLRIIGESIDVPVHVEMGNSDPVAVCQRGIEAARKADAQVCILDTAGRLAIDEELMQQLKRIEQQTKPDEVYLVVDGMTGQDAVNSAGAFNDAIELNGVIMTKMDGDARGGAVLSVKHVTGVPVKFLGTGEHLEALEPFRPEGMASRILGMGDIVEMFRTAQTEFDSKEMADAEERMRKGLFTLEDFRKQMIQMARPGLMQRMLGLLPGMGELNKIMSDDSAMSGIRSMTGIIDSMTPQERRNPSIIDPSRRRRIAAGAGVQGNVVTDLIRQFDAMANMMKMMTGKGIGDRMQMMRELQSKMASDPYGTGLAAKKKGTGKRLSNEEKIRARKERERELRRRKRGGK